MADLLPVRTLGERMSLLSRLRPASRRAAWIAAIRASRGSERATILTTALAETRRDDELLADIASLWPDLSTEARDDLIASATGRLVALADHLTNHTRSATDAAAAVAARAIGTLAVTQAEALPLSKRLVSCLTHRTPPVWVLDEISRASKLPRATTLLDEAVTLSLESFGDHRHEPTLLAALRLAAKPGPKLAEWFASADGAGHFALRAAVRRLPSHTFAELAIPLLGAPALASIVASRIGSIDPQDHPALLAQGHRLRAPARAAALRRAGTDLGSRIAQTAPSDARRGALDWVECGISAPGPRLDRLAERLTDPDPDVRMRAVRAMRRIPATPALDRALLEFALDPAEPVAQAAAAILCGATGSRRRESLIDTLRTLARSPHAAVRTRAARAARSIGCTNAPDGSRVWHCSIAARRALRADRVAVLRELRAQMESASPEAALHAIRLVERLDLATDLHAVLTRALDASDTRIAASAVRALARSSDAASRSAVVRAIGHADPRVRANALEELHRADATPSPAVPAAHAFYADAIPRIRANAVAAMLRRSTDDPEARKALEAMLADPRPAHRRSGLWVVERLAMLTFSPTVAQIVRTESDPAVRTRALRCGKRLLDHLLAASAKITPATPKPAEALAS